MSERPVIDPAPNAPRRSRSNRTAWPLSALVALLFFVAIVLSVGAMVWSIGGVPARGLAAIAALLAASLIVPQAAADALHRQRGLLLLMVGVAALGAFVSLLNDMPPVDLLQQIVEIHVQSAVFLLLATMVADICGGAALVLLFVAAVGVSALFATAQFLGVQAAWTIRDAIAHFTHEVVRYDRTRPPGLADSPIALATHLTLALAAVLVWRQRLNEAAGTARRFDFVALLAVAAFCLVCLASGNRSPILGAALLLAIYSAVRAPRMFLLVSPFILLAIPLAELAFEALQGTGLRAFETGDKSSEGRGTLFFYGLQLFRERPIGYGLGFDPPLYWGSHAEFLMRFPDPGPVLKFELHDYPLTMLNYYGVGILMFLPVAFKMMRRNATAVLAFLPYIIHILFHNYGPFAKNDALVFVAIAAAMVPLSLRSRTARPAVGGRASQPREPAIADYPYS